MQARCARWMGMLILGGLLVGGTAPGWAQGSITDGDCTFTYSSSTATYGLGNFTPVAGTDHLYQQWWYYRLSTQSAETNLPYPPPATAQTYAGNVADIDITTASFNASLEITLTDALAAGAGTTVHAMTISNPSNADLAMELFCYADFDVVFSSGDSAAFVNGDPTHIRITDTTGAYSDFLGVGALAYQVTGFATLRGLLQDAAVTNLNNTGIPFAAGDFTGGFQWSLAIPAGGSTTVHVVITCNELAVAPVVGPTSPNLRRGDCNNDGATNISDAIYVLSYLFPVGAPPPVLPCQDACDANDDAGLNLVDAIAILNANFAQPIIPLPPPTTCGQDTTADALTCAGFSSCP